MVLGAGTWVVSEVALPRDRSGGLLVLGAVAALLALHELRILSFPMPTSTWQVPASWRSWRSDTLMATAFGFGLGMGVLTRVSSYAFYALVGGLALSSDVLVASAAGALYGASRAAWVAFLVRHQHATAASDLIAVLLARSGPVHYLNGLVLMAVGGLLFGGSV